jgi:hypothetical protein
MRPDAVKQLLIELIEEAYRGPAWHGPALKATLRGITRPETIWRPPSGRHSIWELTVHAAFWKYRVAQRLRPGGPPFPLKGSNWFSVPAGAIGPAWRDATRLLEDQHERLVAALEQFPSAKLRARLPSIDQTAMTNVRGAALHDVYHAGQIQMLRRMFSRQAERAVM